ncbi:MAG: hypothetical protein M1816_005909 [Peltula sp. TS41687]|nr:MAG: hypothetical protein M1816_005909 [Peltula sp. TS41687]
MDVRLSEMQGWNNLHFTILAPGNRSSGSPTVFFTQGQCIKGFQDIIDKATGTPDCQGYSGRKPGDGMGNFYGGASGEGSTAMTYDPNAPEFYMSVE